MLRYSKIRDLTLPQPESESTLYSLGWLCSFKFPGLISYQSATLRYYVRTVIMTQRIGVYLRL